MGQWTIAPRIPAMQLAAGTTSALLVDVANTADTPGEVTLTVTAEPAAAWVRVGAATRPVAAGASVLFAVTVAPPATAAGVYRLRLGAAQATATVTLTVDPPVDFGLPPLPTWSIVPEAAVVDISLEASTETAFVVTGPPGVRVRVEPELLSPLIYEAPSPDKFPSAIVVPDNPPYLPASGTVRVRVEIVPGEHPVEEFAALLYEDETGTLKARSDSVFASAIFPPLDGRLDEQPL